MKNILVTGVSRGMGEATAKLLVYEGYFVYGVYNSNQKEAENLKKELQNIELFKCDFSKRKETETLIEKLKDVKFDGIVNSAGIFEPIDFEKLDIKNWDKTFEVNLNAPLMLVQSLRNNLNDNASIVNISSTDGMVGAVSGIAYAASKAALINLTMTFTNLFAKRKIRANVIAPGWIGDGMRSPDELLKEAAELNPLKRNGTYEEIAQIVSFLLSDKSSYINGATITVDGGASATSYILQKEADIVLK
jgi:3-oxoacyl-[acyl-carrier protein] reductase